MKAVTYCSKYDFRLRDVPDPEILNARDAIIKVTSTAICGSDLHLYDGYVPTMKPGDIIGHEFMGIVAEVGSEVRKLKVGDRVIVPFVIACGNCFFCQRGLYSCCDNTNPNAYMVEAQYGLSCAGMFGYSHMFGGYAGGQAQYVRVPFADVGPFKVPAELSDEKVLFLTDIFPTGYQAAEQANISSGDTVAIWGAGPVGQFAVRSAFLLGASRVISIDDTPERLDMAAAAGATPVNMGHEEVYKKVMDLTAGRGADACIDAVGLESHGLTVDAMVDKVKAATFLATDRPHALRQAIQCCRKGGTVSVPGVYAGLLDKFPFGAAFGKGLTLRGGQTHVQRYLPKLLQHIVDGDIDPTFVITHKVGLSEAPRMYEVFRNHKDECIKVVLDPAN
jgi:threonine dehydrogenase-like Zn-dependent dehydrogenase